MLGIFGKIPDIDAVKTRLQFALSRGDAERFYLASLSDTLETACEVAERPLLFVPPRSTGELDGGALDHLAERLRQAGLASSTWERITIQAQVGADLGARMEHALTVLSSDHGQPDPALLVGSDSPSLTAAQLRRGLDLLQPTAGLPAQGPSAPDLVLGPAADGGYYAIGVRRPVVGLLRDIAWSTPRALADTTARARALDLSIAWMEPWSDVDRPEDLPTLAREIATLRAAGDLRTARHSERFLESAGIDARMPPGEES